jgi:hypothetical protein
MTRPATLEPIEKSVQIESVIDVLGMKGLAERVDCTGEAAWL